MIMDDSKKSAERFGGPGSSREDRMQPNTSSRRKGPDPGAPTNSRSSKVSGGGGERDKHHSHDPDDKR